MVYGTAVRMLGDAAEAEDVAQTVFLKAYERFDRLRGPRAGGWLRTVTRNLCLNHLTRFRARWRLFSERRAEGRRPLEDSIPTPGTQVLEMERGQRRDRLERGLRNLPDHQRVPIVLFHFEQRSYRQIADLLRVSLGKVKTDIHRGRLALRALMEAEDGPA